MSLSRRNFLAGAAATTAVVPIASAIAAAPPELFVVELDYGRKVVYVTGTEILARQQAYRVETVRWEQDKLNGLRNRQLQLLAADLRELDVMQ